MVRRVQFLLMYLAIGGCVEPYEFVIDNVTPALVVEAHISDKSFRESLLYPSDGRYFSVKLSSTGDVTNVRPVPVSGAVIRLESSDGREWAYTEKVNGTYELLDSVFHAERGIAYRLRISGRDEQEYESAWEALPDVSAPEMGEIGFQETSIQAYSMEAGKWILRDYKGVQVRVHVPENNTLHAIYYRWRFEPLWIFKAALSSVVDVGNICWATDPNYLNRYEMQTDLTGGYEKELFFIRSVRNERIYEKFSALITQQVLSKDFSNFWKEMKERNEGSKMMDKPPYNLRTNLHSSSSGKPVYGYFGVVAEQAKRWYFSKSDLSYTVYNTLRDDCLANFGGPPAPECYNCAAYSFGIATTKKPIWWE